MAQQPQCIFSINDYPFGMLMPGRSYSSTAYKYGFNGQEKDDELKGNGNSLEFKFRIYDSRIAKFLSIDPLTKNYSYYTPYQFAGNKPIACIDLEGAEDYYYKLAWDDKGENPTLTLVTVKPDLIPGFLSSVYINNEYVGDGLTPKDAQKLAEHYGNFNKLQYSAFRKDAEKSQKEFNEKIDKEANEMGEAFAFAAAARKPNKSYIDQVSTIVKKPGRIPILESAVGGKIIAKKNSPYLTVKKGDLTFHIDNERVKVFKYNPKNPSSLGDQVDFKKYGVPEGSEIIQGAGKGHKRTPTPDELKMYNEYISKKN